MKKILIRRIKINKSGLPYEQRRQNGMRFNYEEMKKKFTPALLELGDLDTPSREIEAIAAIFDLSGFTRFCNQVDAYLAIPRFLNRFLEWFFDGLRKSFVEQARNGRASLWMDLPIMVKFLGDGLLVVWDSGNMADALACRLVTVLFDLCRSYRSRFYPEISRLVDRPPVVLRCGVARGRVFSIGGGRDYVGHCINTAARLSHLSTLTFCFPNRGFSVRESMPVEYARLFVPQYAIIRGVGEDEIIWVLAEELDKVPERDRALFRDLEEVFV